MCCLLFSSIGFILLFVLSVQSKKLNVHLIYAAYRFFNHLGLVIPQQILFVYFISKYKIQFIRYKWNYNFCIRSICITQIVNLFIVLLFIVLLFIVPLFIVTSIYSSSIYSYLYSIYITSIYSYLYL